MSAVRSDDAAARTQRSFGLLWQESGAGRIRRHDFNHAERACDAVGLRVPASAGVILDAGCGAGVELRWLAEAHPDATVVGMDSSVAIDVPAQQVSRTPNAHVVRGSVLNPPFAEQSFGLVFCYGVLHHTPDPAGAFARLAAVVAPRGQLLVYVYSDLREEPLVRAAVAGVTRVRRLTTRLRPETVMRFARALAPLVYLVFSVPAAILRRSRRLAPFADRIPFNFVEHPMASAGDLYDRFSAPIEHRHSRVEVLGWYAAEGFEGVRVASIPGARGWVAIGTRPPSSLA